MSLDPQAQLLLSLDPGQILRAQGIVPDPWQQQVLLATEKEVDLLCSRGAGKSRVVSALALHDAYFRPKSLTLLLSRTRRQSGELFRYVKQGYNATHRILASVKENESELELENGSRIVALPGTEATVRSLQGVTRLIIDEAARVPDDLYRTVTPMIQVSGGRLLTLSTPFGQRGWWYDKVTSPTNKARLFKVTWRDCPRYTEALIAEERSKHGDSWVKQEYECSFEALEGLVYPDFDGHCGTDFSPMVGKPMGGIDWGYRNPFAAIWGYLDNKDVLWVTDEVYLRETPLHEATKRLPRRGITWYADPAGAQEIQALRYAGFSLRKGNNDIRAGIAAVRARIETGRLKVCRHRCPNLCAEAKLYRYPSRTEQAKGAKAEIPVDAHNHALGALRYLVSRLDWEFLARWRKAHGLDAKGQQPQEQDGTLDIDPVEETAKSLEGRGKSVKPKADEESPEERRRRLINTEDAWSSLN